MGGNLGGGKSLLENWVKTYRDPSYSCAATTPEAFQSEICGSAASSCGARAMPIPTSCV